MMARFILFIALILVLYYVLHILIRDMPSVRKKMRGIADPEELVRDPYCQVYIPKRTAVKGEGRERAITSAVKNASKVF